MMFPSPPRLRVAATFAFAVLAVLAPRSAWAEPVKGAIEKVEAEGRAVVIGGKTIALSGSRSNICIKGVCDQPRNKLASGMTCEGEAVMRDGKLEARRLSCR